MKILHVIEKIEKAAGTTTFCVRVAEELSKRGNEVAILIKKENPLNDAIPRYGVNVIRYAVGDALPFEPDIVHFHGIWPPWQHRIQSFFESQGYSVVLSTHGMLAPWAMAHKRWKKIIPWYVYQKGDINRSKLIFSTSAKETCWIKDLGFKTPIIEAPLGTDIEFSGRPASHNMPIKFLSFVGRIYPVKGLDLLLKAWAKLKSEDWDWHLFLIGPDQSGYMGELVKLAKTLNLTVRYGGVDGVGASDITFAGPLFGAEKVSALAQSRGLLLPSYTENFGGVVIDALSLGLPVLASRATPWEILRDRGCGWQFELSAESLRDSLFTFTCLSDNERRDMGCRGCELVKVKYTWNAVCQKVENAYESVCRLSSEDRVL